MPIRIYALAKDLNIDSKDLVDICSKAGITGKGSALASLTDDEVVKVKAYLSDKAGPAPGSSSPTSGSARSGVTTPFSREDYISLAAGSKPKVINVKSPSRKGDRKETESDQQPEVAADDVGTESPAAEVPVADDSPAIAAESVPETPAAAPASKEPAPVKSPPPLSRLSGAPERPQASEIRRPINLSGPAAREKRSGGGQKPQQKKDPVVRVAAIPEAKAPPKKKKDAEPAPQKPIMTLPVDAIRSAKSGSRAPLEQFTKHSDRRREKDNEDDVRSRKPGVTEDPSTAGKGREKDRKKGKHQPEELDDEKKLANMASTRASRQQKRRRNVVSDEDEGSTPSRPRRRRLTRKGTNTAAPRKGRVVVELPCTVRSLSEASGVATTQILRTLMSMGNMVNINAELDEEMAEMLAVELDMDVDFKQPETLEEQMLAELEAVDDPPESLKNRAPVITFLGHVDHGKTSLLDRIIGINVVSGEAGGITQHIRAYKIDKDGREISFVDTPGHEAFTEMRARGANVTDIAVLVVAADDGVMPQTEEAISHAKAANVPIVIALNKIDVPGADVNKAFQDLAARELLPVEWGGEVEVVKTSAITGEGIDDLLETLLLTADLHEYKANPDRSASGVCLEAEQEVNRGVVAKVIVKNGTLRVGDVVVCGAGHGRVKALYDTLNTRKRLTEAGPSTPVSLIGLDIAPEAGDAFHVVDDVAKAREIAENRQHQTRSRSLSGRNVRVSFEEFQRRLEDGRLGRGEEQAVLNLILRADVRGSIEAIQKELGKLDHPEVRVNVMQASVGAVSSADVTLADASDAVIVGFNVIPDENARTLAEERGVEIRRYDIIYKVSEDIKAMLEGKLKPEERVTELGRALVQQTFNISRVGTVAGCRVLAGNIERGCRIRVNREGRGIGDYPLDSLKREKDDAKEVREGFECGIRLAGFNDLKEGDILEAYKIEEFARTL